LKRLQLGAFARAAPGRGRCRHADGPGFGRIARLSARMPDEILAEAVGPVV
jgi:hypothetical protein